MNKHIILMSLLILVSYTHIGKACVPDDLTLCLENNRFQVMLNWRDAQDNNFTIDNLNQFGYGKKNKLFDDSGTFWFFGNQNHELLVKVLDGCAINNHFWVFSAATTNVEFTLTVTDTSNGISKQYFNPLGNPAPAITDTSAFDTCSMNRVNNRAHYKKSINDLTQSQINLNNQNNNYYSKFTGQFSCNADMTTMCLHGDRFSVTVNWEDFNQSMGPGMKSNLTDQSGYFTFFSPNNPDLLLNIYDAQSINNSYWVYLSAITNVAFTVNVTDTLTGITRVYSNPLGSSTIILDNQGNGDIIFKNGFE